MQEEILNKTEEKMKKTRENLSNHLRSFRTSRATPALLDRIKIDLDGQVMSLNQVSTISCPDARLLTLQVWDKSLVSNIEKAIIKSDLGLTPQTAGNIIRLNIPHLTEERRKELVKVAKKEGENAKVVIRNIRRETNEEIKKIEKDKHIPEDECKKLQEKVQKLTDKCVEEIEKILSAKEKEIMEI